MKADISLAMKLSVITSLSSRPLVELARSEMLLEDSTDSALDGYTVDPPMLQTVSLLSWERLFGFCMEKWSGSLVASAALLFCEEEFF